MYNIQHKARKIGTCSTSITNALTRRQHKARLFNTNETLTLWEIVCGMVRFLNVLMYKMILYLSATPSIEGISFTVCFFLCPGKDVSAAVQVQPIVVTFCVIVSLYITPMCLPLLGRYPKSSQNPTFWAFKSHLTANISKTVSRIVHCQLDLGLNISSTGAF